MKRNWRRVVRAERRRVKRYLGYLYRAARFRRDALSLHRPILVYQMGKVGSTTVYRSLKASKLPNPIYHLHHLSRDGIKRARDRLRDTPAYRRPQHVHTSIVVRRRMDRGHKAWMVITLVRDPVARAVSDLFQNARTFYPEVLDDHGNVQPHQAVARLRTKFSCFDERTDHVCTWFDREVWPVFGIDVFAVPFARERGYQIYESERAKLLVIRLEDLNVRFEEALSEFLPGSCHVPMVRGNVGTQKSQRAAYQAVLDCLALPGDAVESVYSTRFAQHFYSQRMLSEFVERWTTKG